MIFIIDNLKYDTDNMELISEKCEYRYNSYIFGDFFFPGKNVKLFRSKKGRWLLTYNTDYSTRAVAVTESKVKELLLRYDYLVYEKIFGEIEEA